MLKYNFTKHVLEFLNSEIRLYEPEKNGTFIENWMKASVVGLAFYLLVNAFFLVSDSLENLKIKFILFLIYFACIILPVVTINNLIIAAWFYLLNLNTSYYIYAWSVVSVLFVTIIDAFKTL